MRAQNVDRGACAAVAEADIQADFPLGIDAALGWETSATDKALADTLPSVKPGEYERVNGLLEKTIYGGIVLEPFEERALDLFVQRLWGRKAGKCALNCGMRTCWRRNKKKSRGDRLRDLTIAAADGRRRAAVPRAYAAVRCAEECAAGFPEKVHKNRR